MNNEHWMKAALALAAKAEMKGEVPVGAVVVLENRIIGQGRNSVISDNDPSAHAEIMACRDASKHMNNYRLLGATLYVTLEPCLMCAGALIHARIAKLVYGADDPKTGVIKSCESMLEKSFLNHQCEIQSGVLSYECGKILSEFFKKKR